MLSGERVVLRPFRPEDVEPLWRAKLDPLTWARTSDAPLVPDTPSSRTRTAPGTRTVRVWNRRS